MSRRSTRSPLLPESVEMDAGSAPVPTVVYLSGRLRGRTLRLSGDEIRVGGGPGAGVPLPDRAPSDESGPHAVLTRQGRTYRIQVTEGRHVWLNGEPVRSASLASGDVLEVGRNGQILRFRLHPPGSRGHKSLAEVFTDCLDCARYADEGALGSARVFLGQLPGAVATQTSRTFRAGMLLALLALAVVSASALRKSAELEGRLQLQTATLDRMEELMASTRREVVTPEDLTAFIRAAPSGTFPEGELQYLREEVDRNNERIGALEGRVGASARVAALASGSTALVLGSYGFRHPEDGRPLRFREGAAGRPLLGINGQPLVTFDEAGPEVEMQYTGTAFLVGGDGTLVTNRHVAVPWDYDPMAQRLVADGLVPAMTRYMAYLPGHPDPMELRMVRTGEDSRAPDVAILRLMTPPEGLRPLDVRPAPPTAGEDVFVMGYPLGIRAIVARAGTAFMESLRAQGGGEMWGVAQLLSDRELITPLVTRGIVGQVTGDVVTYDAQTTSGGSGGPVLDGEGRVVAVNMAVLPDFAGSNLGVPAARILELLDSDDGDGGR